MGSLSAQLRGHLSVIQYAQPLALNSTFGLASLAAELEAASLQEYSTAETSSADTIEFILEDATSGSHNKLSTSQETGTSSEMKMIPLPIDSYPIVVHNFSTRFDLRLESLDFQRLCRQCWGDRLGEKQPQNNGAGVTSSLGITHVHWLGSTENSVKKREFSSIVIHLNDKNVANDTIARHEFVLDMLPHTIERYTRQCFRCQKFGHVAVQCQNNAQCGVCAGQHLSKDCRCTSAIPCAETKRCIHMETKCVTCGGNHRSRYRFCPSRRAAQRQIAGTCYS